VYHTHRSALRLLARYPVHKLATHGAWHSRAQSNLGLHAAQGKAVQADRVAPVHHPLQLHHDPLGPHAIRCGYANDLRGGSEGGGGRGGGEGSVGDFKLSSRPGNSRDLCEGAWAATPLFAQDGARHALGFFLLHRAMGSSPLLAETTPKYPRVAANPTVAEITALVYKKPQKKPAQLCVSQVRCAGGCVPLPAPLRHVSTQVLPSAPPLTLVACRHARPCSTLGGEGPTVP
jgi:hypothetical protein